MWLLLISLLLMADSVASAQVRGDADCNGRVEAADVDAASQAPFRGSTCATADTNQDDRLTAADVTEVLRVLAKAPTSSPTSTATWTVSPTPTATATPTLTPFPTPSVTCPGAAVLHLTVDDQSAAMSGERRLSGRRVRATCRNDTGLAESYSIDAAALDATVADLAPGVWVHSLGTSLGQRQYRRSLLLANSSTNEMRFVAFAAVVTVATSEDQVGGGSLRDALAAAPDLAEPLLIQFDETAFPAGVETSIRLVRVLPPLAADNVTIDATDSAGNIGTRVVDVAGRNAGGLSITGSGNRVIGLALRNAGGSDRDLISISGPLASGNAIEGCVIRQASGDGIGIDGGAGTGFDASANIVRGCDIAAVDDKGIKVTTDSYARLEDNWVHDNANGGAQATLSGHITAVDNVIERSGGASAQNGLAVNGAAPTSPAIASEVYTDGNLIRGNGANGISVRGYSRAFLHRDYVSSNASSGIRVFDQGLLPAASAMVEGVTVACNAINGAVVADSSTADFGGGSFGSVGDNAFTQTGDTDANLRNGTGVDVFARNNQWEHCGTGSSCDDVGIAAHDLSDHGAHTRFSVAQAHRGLLAPTLASSRPSKGLSGDRVRIFGSGFNVIDAHASGSSCPDLTVRNSCNPLRGNCVRIDGVAAVLEAVTPTMIVVQLPFSCVEPKLLTVQTQGGGLSDPITVCTNPAVE